MKRKTILLVLAVVLVGAVCMRGRARPVALLDGQVRDIVAGAPGVFWLEVPATEGPVRLVGLPHGGGRPVVIMNGHDLRSVFLDGQRLLVVGSTGPEIETGQLTIIDLRTGERESFDGLHRPQGIWAEGERMCWAEARQARGASVVHVPVLQHLQAIRAGTPGQARLLGVAESSQPHFTGQILGSDGTHYYWVERVGEGLSEGATVVRRCAAETGEAEALARGVGSNVGVLSRDSLWWTTYSREMSSPGSGRYVIRQPLEGGEPAEVTDWLPSTGALVAEGSTVWFAGGGHVWRVPATLADPAPVAVSGANGPGQATVYRGNEYSPEQLEDRSAIVRRPVSPWGALRAALSLPGSLESVGQVTP